LEIGDSLACFCEEEEEEEEEEESEGEEGSNQALGGI
jgi:hypothetical protein